MAGEAIVGSLTGERLPVLASTMSAWEEWRRLHPDTLVLSRETGHARSYDRDPFVGYDRRVNEGLFAFPVGEASQDGRLLPGTGVLSVRMGDEARAYPLSELARGAFVDTMAGRDVVVFTDPDGWYGAAFVPSVEDQALTFSGPGRQITDLETGSLWDLAGRAIDGPLKGSQLERVPAKTGFWFSLVASEPGITVFHAPSG